MHGGAGTALAFAVTFTYISGTPFVDSQVSDVAREHFGGWRGLNVM
jgi:hypothetical protein